MKRYAVYPGSFDPITVGHIDIIERASKLFDHVYVVISLNSSKSNSFFTFEERLKIVKECLSHLPNVTVDIHKGFVYEYALEHECCSIIRGLRTITDYQSENQLFHFNYQLSNKKIDTVSLFADPSHIFLSSSSVKEILAFGGDITPYVPKVVLDYIKEKK